MLEQHARTGSVITERFSNAAVNCLTGSYSRLAAIRGHPVPEQVVFERGDGFLFQAGLDESGYPEYIFPVQEAGALGMSRSGFVVHQEPIDESILGTQLASLIARFDGVVVWVNTAHLRYAEIYRTNDPYLHAVVVDGVADNRGSADIIDCLVVDRTPFACRARMDLDDLRRAVTDRIRSEAHDGMGFLNVIERPADAPANNDLGSMLARQAERFAAEERFRSAVRRYQELCEECFDGPPERAMRAGRRLFQHSSVLYAVPSLTLMAASLTTAGASPAIFARHGHVLRNWQAMGVLGLRFEATAALSVRKRIRERFAILDEATDQLWAAIAAERPGT